MGVQFWVTFTDPAWFENAQEHRGRLAWHITTTLNRIEVSEVQGVRTAILYLLHHLGPIKKGRNEETKRSWCKATPELVLI